MRDYLRDPLVTEAIFVASPVVAEVVRRWLSGEPEGSERVLQTLVRYLVRMSWRPTPFGLFAGCSLGVIGTDTCLKLPARHLWRRRTRLDMHCELALAEELLKDPVLREGIPYRPNSSLYRIGNRWYYAEKLVVPETQVVSYQLASLLEDQFLNVVLASARGGACLSDLAAAIRGIDDEVTLDEAREYLDRLVSEQILISQLTPTVTGPDSLSSIAKVVQPHRPEIAVLIGEVNVGLANLDKCGVGQPRDAYTRVTGTLNQLAVATDPAKLYQVDLYKPAATLSLGPEVVHELERALALMERISPLEKSNDLARFREAFRARYDTNRVPLAEALDRQHGIGFGESEIDEQAPAPLLDGLELFSRSDPSPITLGEREQHLLRRLQDHKTDWTLDDGDVTLLGSVRGPDAAGPDSVGVLATLVASSEDSVAKGEFQVVFHWAQGPSGVELLGRFCYLDDALRQRVMEHLRAEEALRSNCKYAEIVHLPEGRTGNVLRRPILRALEIPYLGVSGAAPDAQILLGDLDVALCENRLTLFSRRLRCEIVPCLTNAHNWEGAPLSTYRFLCALSEERGGRQLRWSWGPFGRVPRLPRVSFGRTVLSLAMWNLTREDLRPLRVRDPVERFSAWQAIRDRFKIPRRCTLVEGDNLLPVDSENTVMVESLAHVATQSGSLTIQERFPDVPGLMARGPDGPYTNELVVPFTRPKPSPTRAPSIPPLYEPRADLRVRYPGSTWLFAKLYTSSVRADDVLRTVIRNLVSDCRASGAIDRWFFIRYADPEWHLRVRFHGKPARLWTDVLAALHSAARLWVGESCLRRFSIETYERELARYGGPEGIRLAERLFEVDSDAVLRILSYIGGDAGEQARWRLALSGVHDLLADFQFGSDKQVELLRRMTMRLIGDVRGPTGPGVLALANRSHQMASHAWKGIGARFHKVREEVQELLTTGSTTDPIVRAGREALAERSRRLRPILLDLTSAASSGRLSSTIEDVAADLAHMHVNRLLRSSHRSQELVIYEFLRRYHDWRRSIKTSNMGGT